MKKIIIEDWSEESDDEFVEDFKDHIVVLQYRGLGTVVDVDLAIHDLYSVINLTTSAFDRGIAADTDDA